MQTRTYAEILARQGEFDAALAIYRKLVAKAPTDLSLKKRIAEIEALAAGLGSAPPRSKSRAQVVLETFLNRIQSRRR